MRKTLKQLQDRKAQLVTQMKAMLDAAGESLTAEQETEYAALEQQLAAIEKDLARESRLQDAEKSLVLPTNRAAATPGISVGADREADAPFASLGEQLQAIVTAGSTGVIDPRLLAGPTGASAAVGADGGFLIRKEFATELFKMAFETGQLSSRCSETPIGANSDGLEVVYIDETSRATGSRWGGVRVYRRAEAETVAASRPKLGKWELRLEDMMGLAWMTDRLSQDAGAMQAVFEEAFTEEFAFTLDDEIFRGNGVGQCLGVLNSPALVTQTKESGQAADTIVAANIMKIWTRVPARSRANGAWFINAEVEPQLQQMQVGGSGGQLVYMPPGGLTQAPFGSLYGRPVIPIEQASAIGDVGDITFLDLEQYKLIRKGGVQQDESIHVRFIYGEKALRWIARVNGQPKVKSAITPYKGAATLSPFVTLEAR